MYKRKSVQKKEIIFPVGKNYKFDVDGAIKIAQQINAIQEKEEKRHLHQCLNFQNN